MSELTLRDVRWFILANANPQAGFYEFKDRLLRRFATPVGFDLQTIDQDCHTCDGSGLYAKDEDCRRCDGTGVHHTSEHWLQRWSLCGHIFHKPMDHAEVYHLHVYKYPDPVREIKGRIKHDPVDSKVALRAYRRLMLRHEPRAFYWHIMGLVKNRLNAHQTKLYFCLIRLRNRTDLFKSNPENIADDVPF